MVIGLSNNNRPGHLTACKRAVPMYSRGLRRGLGRMAAITHQPHQSQESLRAQGSLEVRVWKVSSKFSPFRSLSLGYLGQPGNCSQPCDTGMQIPAPGSRADGSMGRNGEAGGRECYILPRTQGAGGKRINNNNKACRKHFENKVLHKCHLS